MQAKHLNHAVDVFRVLVHFLFCARAQPLLFLESEVLVEKSYLGFGTALTGVYCVNSTPAACPRLSGISTRHHSTLSAQPSQTCLPPYLNSQTDSSHVSHVLCALFIRAVVPYLLLE